MSNHDNGRQVSFAPSPNVPPLTPSQRSLSACDFDLRQASAAVDDLLPKVAGATRQRHADHRQVEIGGTAHGVAGESAEAAAVCGNVAAERKFHRKARDARLVEKGL
jgi:hypothetical protein